MAVRVLHFCGWVAGNKLVICTTFFFCTLLWSSSQIFLEITKFTVSHLQWTLVKEKFSISYKEMCILVSFLEVRIRWFITNITNAFISNKYIFNWQLNSALNIWHWISWVSKHAKKDCIDIFYVTSNYYPQLQLPRASYIKSLLLLICALSVRHSTSRRSISRAECTMKWWNGKITFEAVSILYWKPVSILKAFNTWDGHCCQMEIGIYRGSIS